MSREVQCGIDDPGRQHYEYVTPRQCPSELFARPADRTAESGLKVKELQEREGTISQFTAVVHDLNPSRTERVFGDPTFIDDESDGDDIFKNNSEYAEDKIRKLTPDKDLPDKPEETQDNDDETL